MIQSSSLSLLIDYLSEELFINQLHKLSKQSIYLVTYSYILTTNFQFIIYSPIYYDCYYF